MSAPFSRADAMAAKIAAAMMLAAGTLQDKALMQIGTYESRGKGKGRTQASKNTTAQVKRASIKARNRARAKS